MQEIQRIKDESGYDQYKIKTDNGFFRIIFGGNLDLYWTCYDKEDKDSEIQEFLITKENYFLYELFDELYESIKNNKIYYGENKEKYFEGYVDNLFKDGKIDWYSDDFYEEIASRLLIEKVEDTFKITFLKSKKEWDGIFKTYSIRFRNSGSRYEPFNICFMKMYNKLSEYDSNYHQVHMEEYLYRQKVLKK